MNRKEAIIITVVVVLIIAAIGAYISSTGDDNNNISINENVSKIEYFALTDETTTSTVNGSAFTFNDHGSDYDVVIICDFNIGYSDFGGLIFDTTNASINVVLSSYNIDLSNSGTFYQTFEDHSTIRVGSDQYSNTAYNGGGAGHIVLGLNAKGGSSQIDLKVLIGSKIRDDGAMITGVQKTELSFLLR